MKLVFNTVEFQHIPERSCYNNNYWLHEPTGSIFLELCHEDENYTQYYLMIGEEKIFIGCSINGIGDNTTLDIDFMKDYT